MKGRPPVHRVVSSHPHLFNRRTVSRSYTEILYDRNITKYTCPTIDCKCIPGEMLCGKDGSIDISDLLTDEIKGPASF
ncbi:hypothetical protein BC936DRAFT_142481, partial [Jimgerdemannia flammicorona]